MSIPELGQSAARARQAPAVTVEAPEVPEIIEAETAFLVFRTPDGRTVVSPDLDLPVSPRREPTTHDVVGMCANAQDDIRAQAIIPGIANGVVGMMMQAGQQQAQRQLTPEEQEALRKSMRVK
jgi:hypothetical protein